MNHIRALTRLMLLAFAVSAHSMTIGYDVVVQNVLTEPAIVELAQYHSEKFNAARPSEFTDDLLVYRQRISLAAGASQKIHYTSASGGFWLSWKVLTPESKSAVHGVLDLVKGERSIDVK